MMNNQEVDCEKCKNDIMNAIKDCSGFPNILQCIEDVLMGLAECLVSKYIIRYHFFFKLVKILLVLIIFYKMNTDNDALLNF